MNEHAGPACALSVLIVGLFAIILHEGTPVPISAKPEIKSPATARVASVPEKSESRNSTPEAVTSPKAKEPGPSLPENPKVPASESPKIRELRSEPPVAARTSMPPDRRIGFTVVLEGERLADVSARVYGTSSSAEMLWRANRDQIALIDSPLRSGTLLRTP